MRPTCRCYSPHLSFPIFFTSSPIFNFFWLHKLLLRHSNCSDWRDGKQTCLADFQRVCLTISSLFVPQTLSLQNKGDIPGGEEPAEFPGAAVREVGGELLRRWRAALLHHFGHAHHAAWTMEDFTNIFPAKAPGQRTRTQGLCRLQQQVGLPAPFTLF